MKKVLLALTGIIAIVTTAILLIVCVKNDDNGSSSNLNNITITNTDFTTKWNANAAVEGDYESTTTFEIGIESESESESESDVTVSEQKLYVASGRTLRITNADIPVKIGSSDDVLGNQLILKNTTITLMEQAKLILDVNVVLDNSRIESGAKEGDPYFYPNLEINDSVLLLNGSTINSTNFNETDGVVVNGTLNLDGSSLNSDTTSPITLTEKAMVIAINEATISGKIEGNGGFVTDGTIETIKLTTEIGKLENMTVVDDLDSIDASGNYILYKAVNEKYERGGNAFSYNENIYKSGTMRIIPFYDYTAKGDKGAQFNVDNGATLELGGFTLEGKTYQANTNKFIIDGGANWVKGSNVYFVTGDYDPYNEEGTNPETDNRSAYNNNGTTKTKPILYVRKNSTANLFGGVVIQNVDNSTAGEYHTNIEYGTINIYGETTSDRPKLNVYGATIRFNHANGDKNSRGGAAISASYAGADDTNKADIYIADCDISYNSVWGTSSNDGAAIGLFQNVNLVMDDGVISHNHSSYAGDSDGGAIMVRDGSNLTMNGGTLSYNFVYGYGGAICIYSSSVTINSGNLIYNRASFGGGIASSGGNEENRVQITLGSSENSDLYVAYNEAFANNHTSGGGRKGLGIGGGVSLGNNGDKENYMQYEDLTIKGGLFEYNKALYGGGIASYTVNRDSGNKLTLEGGEIRNNNATNGAGLYIESNYGYVSERTPLLYLSGSAKVDTSNNIQIKGNVSGQVPIEVTDTLTASGIIGLISYADETLYKDNAIYFSNGNRQVDKFLLDSDSHCFVESADVDYIAFAESNSNAPYKVNGTKYSTLKKAVEAIGNNETGTIYVLRNVSLTADDLVTINNGKKITIQSDNSNLPYTLAISKDFDFSSQDTSNPGIIRINPGCTLTLNNINLDGNSSISDGFAFIYNTGTFTLGETASLNNNISNLNGGAINIQQSGSITNIYGTIYGNKGPNGAVYATGENITINIGASAVFENNTALSVNTTLRQAGSATEVENVGLYLGAGVTCNFYGFDDLKDAIFYAGATLNIANKEDDPTSVPANKVNVYISNQFYTTGQIIFNVHESLKNTDFANQFVFANGLENDSFTNGSNNTIIINKVVKAIFDFESDADGKGEVNLDFLTKDKLNVLASLLKIDQSLVTKQGHKLVIYMDVNSQLSLEIIAGRANMAGYKITGFTFNEFTHSLTENVPFYEVSGKFIAKWEENSYTFTFSHQDFNDVMGEMTAVTYNYTTGFEGGSRNIPSNKFYVVGYYFAGWKVVGTDKVLANGQEIKASDMLGMSEALNDSTNITLLAIWKSIFSTENTSDGYRNGKSEATAFIISDVEGLNQLSYTVSQSDILSFDGNNYYNNNTLENGSLKYQPSSYEGYYFKLSADFDNTNAPFSKTIGTAQIKADYNPDTSNPEEGLVAYLTNTYPFSGTFDGNYSDLTSTSGISVNVSINVNGGDFLGLFGYTKDATIKNLKVTGSVTGQNSIAGVTGFMNDGSLTNVVNEANIKSTGYNAGGIVGTFYRAYTNSTNDNLINLVNNGNVTYNGNKTTDLEYSEGWKENKVLNAIEGTRYGGIIGQMWSGRINGGYNSGNIKARMAAGGIVGTMISMNDNSKDDSQINTALNIGNVTVTSGLLSDYQLEGTSFVQHNISAYAGGIAGRLFGASAITNVMNTANIEATYVGYTTNSSNISASSPLTHLVGEPTNMNAFYLGARGVGGIIGITSIEKEGSDFSGGNKSLEYAINTGHISGWSSVGGLVGLLAYSDVRYTINGGTIEAKGYHFIDGQTEVKGGTQIYDPSNNIYKYYNYLGAIVGMAISANIDSTNYFDGDISYVGYTDAVVKATGDEVTSMGNGASTVNANKLASKELIVGASGKKPIGLPETFFNTGWEYKTVLTTEENNYYYYPQLSALANNKILLKEVNVYKTIGELSMDGVILKSTGASGEDEAVTPNKEITITLHLNDGVVVNQKPGDIIKDKFHTYTYNNNNTLTLKVQFDATTGSITLIDSKLLNYVGFEFGGWYKDNKTFEEEFSGFLPSSNVDLYAKWNPINYNITYSGFGSYSDGDVKFDGDYVASFTVNDKEIILPTNVISGNGAFTFKRWIYSSGGEQFEATSFRINKDDNRINKDDNTITIFVKNLDGTDHDPITINIANLEFTLECDPVEYAINYYDAAGNKLTEEELEKYNPWYSYTIRDNVTLPLGVDRVGYRFVGWYLDQTLENEASNIVRGTIGEQNFYAKFEPLNYTLTIDLGRMGSLSGDSLKFTLNGTDYTLVIDNTTYKVDIPYGTSLAGLFAESTGLKDPTPITGYSFNHYSTSVDGDEFDPTDVTMSEKGLTLYAVYETTKYKITIDLSGVLNNENQLQLPQTIDGLKDLYQYKVNDNQLVLSGVEYHDNLEEALNLILKAISTSTENSGKLTGWNFSKWEGPDGFSIYNVMGDKTEVSIKPIYLKDTFTWTILDKDLQTVGTITNKDEGFTTTKFSSNDIYQKFKKSLDVAGYTYLGFYDLSDKNQNLIGDNLKITSNRNIVVKLEAKELKVNFYDKDGKLITELKHNVYYQTEYGKLPEHSEAGYEFKGWSLEENGSTIIQETDIVTVNNILNVDSIDVYAVFDLITYVIKFTNLKGHTINSTNSIKFNVKDDKTIDLNEIITNFQAYSGYTGYRFSYFTDQDGKNKYNSQDHIINVADNLKDITLEAHFEAVKVLVIFNAGDGEDSKFNVNQDDLADGKFVDSLDGLEEVVNADLFNAYYETIQGVGVTSGTAKYFITYVDFGQRPVSPQYPTLEGYIFNKWNPDIVKITAEAKREYEAVYNANTYTIFFITNNGETINPLTDIQHNQTVSETQVNFSKIKTGYHFDGWFINGTGEEFKFGDTKVTSDLTLEAGWTENYYELSITMDYDISDAKVAIVSKLLETLDLYASFDGNTLTVMVEYGTDLSSLNNIFDESGYPVDDNTYYFESYSNGTFTTMPAEDLGVTVSFTKTNPRTVTIHYMGVKGENGENISSIQTNKVSYQDNGGSYLLNNSIYEIQITGYEFNGLFSDASGWFSDATLTNQVSSFTWSGVLPPTDLYLKYDAVELEITLTYINDSYKEDTTPLKVYYGDTLGEVITEEYKHNHPGYSLLGFSEVTNNQILTDSYKFTYDMALIYREEAVTYGIKFSYQKPNGKNIETGIFKIPYGEAIIYSEDYNEEYYDLTWYLKNDPDSELFNEATMPNLGDPEYAKYLHEDNNGKYIVLYAKYTPTKYTVNFDTMGGNSLLPLTITVNNSYNLATPTKEHYEFISYTYGDSTFNENNLKNVTFTELISLFKENEKEITLKANYNLKQYTLKLDDNNRLTFDYEDTSVTITWDDPTKEGANFLGYALTKDQKTPEFLKTIPVSELLKYLDEDGIVTIYPKFSNLNQYQVMFIYETESGIKTNSYTVEHGKTLEYDSTLGDLNDLGEPYRLGYEFKGWNENENAEIWEPTEAIKQEQITKNTTYYAIFSEKTYTIKFDLNGGNGTASDQTLKYTETIDLPTDIKKPNYTFVGFTYNNNLYKDSVKVADLVTNNVITEITLEASYEEEVYTITFDSKGGSAVTSINVKFNDKAPVPTEPTRTGYTFLGWFEANKDTKFDFTNTPVTSNLTLEAKWKANKVNVTFDYNYESVQTTTVEQKYHDYYKFPTEPTRTGYIFLGWFENKENGEEVLANTYVTNEQEHTLYAHWKIDKYKVIFDSNGGTEIEQNELAYGQVIPEPTEPKREGYDFLGWFTDATNGTQITFNNNLTVGSDDVTYYAHWEAYPYTVKYDGLAEEKNTKYDEKFTITNKEVPKKGYEFIGWSTEENPSSVLYNKGEEVINLSVEYNGTVTLHPVYRSINYTITFNSNTGTGHLDNINNVTYNQNTLTLPTNTFTKYGYTFKGWSLSNNGGAVYSDNATLNNSEIINLLQNSDSNTVTLYAIFEANSYTINFNGNANDVTGETSSMRVSYDELNNKLNKNKFVRNGYSFLGWAVKVNNVDRFLYENEDLITNDLYQYVVDGQVTLYALWQLNTYTVSYYDDSTLVFKDTYTVEDDDKSLYAGYQKYGYNFNGWLLNGKLLESLEGKYENLNLYALLPPKEIEITLNNGDTTTTINATYDGKYDKLEEQTKAGYDFLGWYTGETDGINITSETDVKDLNITILYARYEAKSYEITYKNEDNEQVVTVKYDSNSKFAGAIFERKGYNLVGWKVEQKVQTRTNEDYQIDTIIDNEFLLTLTNQKVTLVPVWQAITYAVSYYDDSTLVFTDTYTVEDDDKSLYAGYQKYGYDFNGWLLNGKLLESLEGKYEDLVLTASLSAIKYVVTFTDDSKSYSQTFTYDNMDDTLTNYPFSKFGYTHKDNGWLYNETKINAGASFKDIVTYFDINHQLTLNPNFEPIKYTFTYDNSEQFKDVTIDGSIDLSQITVESETGYDRYQFIINGKIYSSSKNVSVKDIVINDSDTTYEIILEDIQNEYTIKFDQSDITLNFKYEGVITGLPQANVEEGQEFVGWYYDDKLVANGDKISELVKDLQSNGSGKYELRFTAKYDNMMIDGNEININGIGNTKALDDLKNTLRNKLDVHVDDDFSYKIEINDNNDGLIITYSARYDSDISFINEIFPSFIQYEENGVIHTLNLTDTGLSLTKQPVTPSNKTISYTSSDIKVTINYDENEDVIYPSLDENQKYRLDEAILKEKYNKVGYTIDFYTNVNYTEDSKYTFGEESGSITLYIKYIANNYTVTINLDGGASEGFTGSTISVTYDSKYINLPNDPTKDGHTFVGWYLNNTLITEDSIVKVTDDEQTIVAKYNKNSYIVTFNTNGGSYVEGLEVTYGEKITKPEDPNKLGYSFDGWYKDQKLEKEFNFDTPMGSEPITLYAKWEANTNDIEFYDEEGHKLENLGKEYTYTYGKKLGDLYDYEVEDHQEFIGWYYEVDEQKVYVDQNTVCTFTTEGVLKLYAEVGTKTYYINFEFNGGNGTYDKLVSFTGSSYTLPLVDDTNLTRTGYLFEGWKTSLNGDVVYVNGATITSNALTNNSLTLYAKWKAKTYEVTLHYEENTEKITFTYDALNPIKRFNELGWNKEGYTFGGWALAQDSDEVAYQDKANTLNDLFTQNKDLYAIFTPATYTITLDLNGGTNNTVSVEIKTGENILTKLNNNPNKLGYTFTSWKYEGTIITENDTFNYAKDITLKANYNANPYEVTIDLAGGISEGFTADKITVTYDSLYSNLPNNPTKEGHTFVGWYLNNTLITKDSIVKVTDDEQTIVAKYNKNSYNVTFNTNGGSYVEGKEVTFGEKITKPENGPTKLGYEFKYWYQNDENQEFDFNNTTMGSEPITLYAKWKVVEYTITYNGLDDATYNDSNKTTYTVEDEVTFGTPTKNGYRFVNWTLEDGTALTSTKGYTGNLTVKANFEALTYHITYDLNGGTYEGANNLTYTVESDVTFGQAHKDGYTFTGWSLEDGSSISSTKGYTKDLTVVANFKASTYNISIKGHKEIAPISVTFGSQIEGLDKLTITKEGYIFTGFSYNGLIITDGMVYNYASDIEVEASFREIRYTIEFNANGGFGSVSSKNLSYNDEYVLPTTGYTKTGYKFIGWSKTNDGEVIENKVSMLSSVDNSVVTLYAIYEAIEYEISFENSSEIIKIHYGDVISNLPTLKDNPSERFLVWSYNGVEIKDGMLYGYDTNITLTPKFEQKVYYIYLNALTGSLDNSVITMHYGEEIDLSDYLPQAEAGYYFVGWDLDLTTMPGHDLYVKAIYEGIKYNIYFNANGANGNMTFQQATYGEPTKLKANQFAKDGYVFIGWSLSSNGEILYKDESYVNVKVGGLTLYAIFEEATYKINYNLAGGKVTNNPTTYTISSDYVFNKPTKEGYKFVGFYTEDGKLVESTLGLSGNLYLTAKYEAITYNITYTSDLSIDTNLLPKVYSKDNVVTFDSLTKLGYEFMGWYLNGKLVTSTLNMTGDIKLEARFKIIEYKITYVLNGANNHQDNPLKYTIKDELTFKAPTKAGYTFNGWYFSGTDTKVESIIGKTGDLVLEARFTPEKVTVTFVDGNKEIEKVEIDYNSTISQITDPTKEGYVFNSWYLDGNKYDFSKPVTKDITLKAFYNKIALSTTIDDKVITVSSTSGKGLDPNYSLIVTKIVQELPLSNAIDLLYPLGDLVTLYDIKLLDKNGNIVDLGEDVKVTITDASLKEDVTYAVVHVTDDYLDYSSFGEYKAANNTISFVTPHFSMFGVVEVFEPINLTWLWVLIVLAVTAGFAFAIVVIVKNRKYQIKFVTNGGSLIAPMRLKEDALVELPSAINPGYKFKGWYLDEKLMKEAHFGSMPKENLTLFAKWERDMEAPKSKQ